MDQVMPLLLPRRGGPWASLLSGQFRAAERITADRRKLQLGRVTVFPIVEKKQKGKQKDHRFLVL